MYKRQKYYYDAPNRESGKSTNNFFSLYTIAVEGIVSTSTLPFKLISLIGLISTLLSIFFITIGLISEFFDSFFFNYEFSLIGLSILLFSSIQLLFIGLIGEYLLVNQTRNQNMPLVVERERINF